MSIPEKMHGLVLKDDGFSGTSEEPAISTLEPYLDFIELDVPEPQDGQVLIKTIMASVNPSDMHFIKGEYGVPRRKGIPAGFEAVGQVVKAGKGGDGLIGKRVGFFGSASGAWADYAISEISMCVPVIDQVRDEDAAALLVNPLTAIAMYEEAKADGNNCFIMTAAASQLCKLIAGLAKEDGTKVISVVRRDEHDEDAAALLVNPLTAIAMYEEAKADGNNCFIMTAAASQLCKLIAGLAKEDGTKVISVVRRDEHVESLKHYGSTYVLNCKSPSFDKEMQKLIKEHKPRVMLDAVADQGSSDIFYGHAFGRTMDCLWQTVSR